MCAALVTGLQTQTMCWVFILVAYRTGNWKSGNESRGTPLVPPNKDRNLVFWPRSSMRWGYFFVWVNNVGLRAGKSQFPMTAISPKQS